MDIPAAPRVFKTAQFNKAVKKAHVSDADLCVAVKQALLELSALRNFARIYVEMTEQQIANRVTSKEFVEICDGN
jgi:hypothetical protein